VAPAANLAGTGTVPVGTTHSVNRFGVHDLAGNVREWIRNEVNPNRQRFILGGGWNDPDYAFADAYAQSAWNRAASNGFRCLHEIPGDDARPDALDRVIDLPFRDYAAESPVGDEVFQFFLRLFLYDRAPLNASVDAEFPGTELGHHRIVTVDAAYGGERLPLHVFRPPKHDGPLPVVIVFPGSGSLMRNEFDPAELRRVNYLTKAGYAVILPIYQGTYQRKTAIKADTPEATAAYRDHLVMWGKDLGRTVDYVESRDDLDASRIAYFGLSWGGQLGGILPAVEKRIRANVLYVAGFSFQRPLPEADAINYVPRVTQPTLMLNGELDFYFPRETSQRPMFERLGTPDEHKSWKTYPGAHSVPRVALVQESLAWLERYLAKG
ncbi:MAG: dienelactone hydrolase family protein, partial [Gemmatimonadetes bacterium]|nr:dienelactone hydrolase family protein [Gemmatimonadota bacterium]